MEESSKIGLVKHKKCGREKKGNPINFKLLPFFPSSASLNACLVFILPIGTKKDLKNTVNGNMMMVARRWRQCSGGGR